MSILQSRKFKVAVGGLATLLITAWVSGVPVDPNTLVQAIAAVVIALIGSIAWEDAAMKGTLGGLLYHEGMADEDDGDL